MWENILSSVVIVLILILLVGRTLVLLLDRRKEPEFATAVLQGSSTVEMIFIKANNAVKGIMYFFIEGLVAMFLKVLLLSYGIAYFIFSTDRKGIKEAIALQDVEQIRQSDIVGQKTIIFMRHGESVWNYVFNRIRSVGIIFRVLLCIICEFFLFPDRDVLLIDSPLSANGITECIKLREQIFQSSIGTKDASRSNRSGRGKFQPSVKKESHRELLMGASSEPNTVIVRTISTAIIVFGERIRTKGEDICVLPCLQEAGRNLDCVSLLSTLSARWVSLLERGLSHLKMTSYYNKALDTSLQTGSKTLQHRLIDRFLDFGDWIFSKNCKTENVIVIGHSGWIRHFFSVHLNNLHDIMPFYGMAAA
ncbi:phosphoglycerate mutase family protein [Cardiosporidium cionae]|uniref:Phosphoglycerate mutase family protein n=1 Tax=Cardiosporidium cionae TaxID=476202 RepID=A0ABQ7JB08_9APIC|nr:phosphoglycerate mutase family protein [Cardiosporidium cionae]|eukprot:KAF8821161.1 phosphoglycerate mutase family protein [Cardiosporidium cionae]